MTLADLPPYAQLTADGQQATFDVPFAFFQMQDLVVYLGPRRLFLGPDYLVQGAIRQGQGQIQLAQAPEAGATLTLLRETPLLQQASYRRNLPFPMATHEWSLDRAVASAQELRDTLKRTWQAPAWDPDANLDQLAGVRICRLEADLPAGRYQLVPLIWDAGEGGWVEAGEALEAAPFNPCPHLAPGSLVKAYRLLAEDGSRVWRFTLEGACPEPAPTPPDDYTCLTCGECEYSSLSTVGFIKPPGPSPTTGIPLNDYLYQAYADLDTSAMPRAAWPGAGATWLVRSEPAFIDGYWHRVSIYAYRSCSGPTRGQWFLDVALEMKWHPDDDWWDEIIFPCHAYYDQPDSVCEAPAVMPVWWFDKEPPEVSAIQLNLVNDTTRCPNCHDCYYGDDDTVTFYSYYEHSGDLNRNPECQTGVVTTHEIEGTLEKKEGSACVWAGELMGVWKEDGEPFDSWTVPITVTRGDGHWAVAADFNDVIHDSDSPEADPDRNEGGDCHGAGFSFLTCNTVDLGGGWYDHVKSGRTLTLTVNPGGDSAP